MQTTLPRALSLATCLFASACLATAEEAVVKLTLDERPVFESLSKAGLRFQLPRMEMGNDQTPSGQRGMNLTVMGKAGLTLDFGGAFSKSAGGCEIGVSFAGKDLNPAGETYPPRLPIEGATPVKSLVIQTGGLPEESFREWLGSCTALFKMDTEKSDAWLQHRLWEAGASYIEIKHDTKDFRVEMSLAGPDARQQRSVFSAVVSIVWTAGDDPEGRQSVPGQPRQRVVPPPTTGGNGVTPR